MELSEIRIGNWLNCLPTEKIPPHQVTRDTMQQFCAPATEWYLETFAPIPLTEEWMKKFGIEPKVISGWIMYEVVNLGECTYFVKFWGDSVEGREGLCGIDMQIRDYSDGKSLHWIEEFVDIEHVHELQNFVYVHSFKELTTEEVT